MLRYPDGTMWISSKVEFVTGDVLRWDDDEMSLCHIDKVFEGDVFGCHHATMWRRQYDNLIRCWDIKRLRC